MASTQPAQGSSSHRHYAQNQAISSSSPSGKGTSNPRTTATRGGFKRAYTTPHISSMAAAASPFANDHDHGSVNDRHDALRPAPNPPPTLQHHGTNDTSIMSLEHDAMQQALCRLSSQHYLSDYNRLKRLTAAGVASQGMAVTASYPSAGRQQVQQPATRHSPPQKRTHPTTAAPWASSPTSGVLSLSTLTMPARAPGGPSHSPGDAAAAYAAHALMGLTNQSPGLDQPFNERNDHARHSAFASEPSKSNALDRQPSLDPPPAPKLHRTYTEEEGQNPHLHLAAIPSALSSSSARMTTQTLPAVSSSRQNWQAGISATPPDEFATPGSTLRSTLSDGSTHEYTYRPAFTQVASPDRSPVGLKTKADESNDRELSAKLLDAMDESVVPRSQIPMRHSSPGRRTAASSASTINAARRTGGGPVTATRSAAASSNTSPGSLSPSLSASSSSTSTSLSMRTSASASASMSRASTNLTHATSTSSFASSLSGSPKTATSSPSASPRSSTAGLRAAVSALPKLLPKSAFAGSSNASAPIASASAQTSSTTPAGADVYVVEDPLHSHPYYVNASHPGLAGVKTSITHPMNVSPLIPPELLPLYGQSILHAPPHYAASGVSATSNGGQQSVQPQPRSRSPLGKLSMNELPPGSNLNNAGRPGSPTKSSSSSMMNTSRPGTPSGGDPVKPDNQHHRASSAHDYHERPFVLQASADIHSLIGPNASAALFNLTLPISQQLAMTSVNAASDGTAGKAAAESGPVKLGNLVLSSCPGKKVRVTSQHLTILGIPEICRPGPPPNVLDGNGALVDPRTLPNAGVAVQFGLNRSPICRDLELDFRRAISEADVKCVVCCIDDSELRFLGAAWEEYEKVAQHLGLEVIRLPMAEGFAPPSPQVLDAHLTYLITRYTLQGKSALVHCRGGVGRAGLFACSWMIKLGLLGQIIQIHDPAGKTLDQEMKVVEKVIAVIRKRRSAKAIETPQQVHFILQYTHWLSTIGRPVTAKEVLQDLDAGLIKG